MALNSLGRKTNIKRSIDKYLHFNLYTNEGINIDFEGLPFNNISLHEWIQARIINFNPTYHRQGSSMEYGSDVKIFLQLNIFVKKSNLTVSDRHYVIRDIIANYFKIGEDIDIIDYYDSLDYLCNIRVREIITDSPMPETNTLCHYMLVYGMNYTELISFAGYYILQENGYYILQETGFPIIL